jgi:hypothetical protein
MLLLCAVGMACVVPYLPIAIPISQ